MTPHALTTHMEPPPTSQPTATATLTPAEKSHLEALLAHKLRGIPIHHIPPLTLSDILHPTRLTNLPHIPPDINLTWLLRNRFSIDAFNSIPLKEGHAQDFNITRAIFFYRLSPTHQFQRYHDAARWTLLIFTALHAQHSLTSDPHTHTHAHISRPTEHSLPPTSHGSRLLTPAAHRFITTYLHAAHEAHNSPHSFSRRDAFIDLWRRGVYDFFPFHKAWVRKALQRAAKKLSREWALEIEGARRQMRGGEFERRVGGLVGGVVPGRKEQEGGREVGRGAGVVREGGELLEALRVECPVREGDGDGNGDGDGGVRDMVDGEVTTVCDMRTAIACVQSVRPRNMLPVLVRLLSATGDGC